MHNQAVSIECRGHRAVLRLNRLAQSNSDLVEQLETHGLRQNDAPYQHVWSIDMRETGGSLVDSIIPIATVLRRFNCAIVTLDPILDMLIQPINETL